MSWPAESAHSEPDAYAGSIASSPRPLRYEQVALVDLLDRVLAGGVVIAGEVTLSIAEVDLVVISLRALIASARALAGPTAGIEGPARDYA